MPEMKGIELLENVSKVSPETLVVIITAYGSIETAISALRQGAVDYILKPVEFDELLVKVKRLLAAQQAEAGEQAAPERAEPAVRLRQHHRAEPRDAAACSRRSRKWP